MTNTGFEPRSLEIFNIILIFGLRTVWFIYLLFIQLRARRLWPVKRQATEAKSRGTKAWIEERTLVYIACTYSTLN